MEFPDPHCVQVRRRPSTHLLTHTYLPPATQRLKSYPSTPPTPDASLSLPPYVCVVVPQTVTVGGQVYRLKQFHVHNAEHQVNGLYYPLEIHMVHFRSVPPPRHSHPPLHLSSRPCLSLVCASCDQLQPPDRRG